MANQPITQSTAVRDGSASFAFYGCQDANLISLASGQDEKFCIIAQNTNNATALETATIVVSPGDAAAWRQDLGSLTLEVADDSAMKVIGPLDSARFKNSAGYIVVNVSVTQGGTVSSVKLGVVKLP